MWNISSRLLAEFVKTARPYWMDRAPLTGFYTIMTLSQNLPDSRDLNILFASKQTISHESHFAEKMLDKLGDKTPL
jgi:hypothetical protein